MSEKLAKPSVAIVQSFLVILLTYLLSAVKRNRDCFNNSYCTLYPPLFCLLYQ